MRKLLLVFSVLAFLSSCQKEADFTPSGQTGGGNTQNNIIGNWKFIDFNAKTKVIGTANDPVLGNIKSITTSDYTTINNGGTLKVDATTMTATDLTYAVNSIAKALFYENNVLVDSVEVPFSATMPSSSSTTTYKKIGADSIYMNSGIFTNAASGGTTQTIGGGTKIKFDGNKMTWISVYSNISTENINGTTVTRNNQATVTTTFQRL